MEQLEIANRASKSNFQKEKRVKNVAKPANPTLVGLVI